MRPPHWLPNRTASLLLAAFVGACLLLIWIYARRWNAASLPYHAPFSDGQTDGWEAMGGMWELDHDTVRNRSDEFGAKLLGGSPRWTDYTVDADVALIGHGGDVGLIVRVSEPEKGINAYRGYYIGLRSQDQALVMGVADHDWMEARPVPMQGGVRYLVWYKLEVFAVGCQIVASAENLQSHQMTWSAMQASPCFAKGRIGLRSLNTGAAFRNVHVSRATAEDVQMIASQLPPPNTERYPVREADYARMRFSYYASRERLLDLMLGPAGSAEREPPQDEPKLESIHSLELTHKAERVRIHGNVTLTDPVYVQDATGGIRVELQGPNTLNVGDEVELVGRVEQGRRAPFVGTGIHVLWEGNPITPASISSTQAASGAFDGSYIELSGVLRSWRQMPDGTMALELDDIAQRFIVYAPHGLSDAMPTWWQIGSTLRVRGVCVAGAQTVPEAAFTVLLRDASDAEYLSAPPWNQGIRLVLLIVAGVFLLLLWAVIYVRGERHRMRSVLAERELLAAEMHDTLAQSFAGVGFYLQSIRRSLRQAPALPNGILDEFDVACKLVTETHREASASIAALHPEAHGGTDLLTQLERLTYSLLGGDKLPVELHREGTPRELSPKIADVLFQIGREAISNVLRHAHATSLQLSLRFHLGHVTLSVADNGVGMACDATHEGFGLQTMRRRCRAVGAELHVETVPGNGTTIRATAPCGGMALWLRWWSRLRRAHKTPN